MSLLLAGLNRFELAALGLSIAPIISIVYLIRSALRDDGVEPKNWKLVSYDELVIMLRQRCIQLFDVREKEEVRNSGMIPNASNIPCMCELRLSRAAL